MNKVGLSVRHLPNEAIANSFALARQDDKKRVALAKLHQRFATTTPPASPPSLTCPSCHRPLVYQQSHIGGVSAKHREQWDDFTCPSCGKFEYRHRAKVAARSTGTRRRFQTALKSLSPKRGDVGVVD